MCRTWTPGKYPNWAAWRVSEKAAEMSAWEAMTVAMVARTTRG